MSKLWDDLSQESRDELIKKYEGNKFIENKLCKDENKFLENLFGKDNLNPIKIRTWNDVLIYKLDNGFDDMLNNYSQDLICNIGKSKLVDKVIATIKINKIIEYGFGGLFTKTDIENGCAFTIRLKRDYSNFNKNFKFEIFIDHNCYDLLSFRSMELAQEFIEHNNILLKQYFMI